MSRRRYPNNIIIREEHEKQLKNDIRKITGVADLDTLERGTVAFYRREQAILGCYLQHIKDEVIEHLATTDLGVKEWFDDHQISLPARKSNELIESKTKILISQGVKDNILMYESDIGFIRDLLTDVAGYISGKDCYSLSCMDSRSKTVLKYCTYLANPSALHVKMFNHLISLNLRPLGNNRRLVQKIPNLRNLKYLILTNNLAITKLNHLTSLTYLDLTDNGMISDIHYLTNLTELRMGRDCCITLPDVIKCSSIVSLILHENQTIKDLSEISHLTKLSLYNDKRMRNISNLAELKSLKLKKTEIADIVLLTNLTKLSISSTSVHKLGYLTNLLSLKVTNNSMVSDISKLTNLTKLTSDNRIDNIQYLINLQTLKLIGTRKISQQNINACTSLTSLSLQGKIAINDVSMLTKLTYLSVMNGNNKRRIICPPGVVNIGK